jgi:hypothetical protein
VDRAEAKARKYLAYATEKLPVRARHGDVKLVDEFVVTLKAEMHPWTHGSKDGSRLVVERDAARRLLIYEVERRADRALMVAIRAAQDKGLMARHGGKPLHRAEYPIRLRDLRSKTPASNIWVLAEYSDAVFEVALGKCREAQVMTREAVLRALGGEPPKITRNKAQVQITNAAAQRRAYEGAVTVMAGLADGLRNLGDIHSSISEGEREKWLTELQKSKSVLARAVNRLRSPEWRAMKQSLGRSAAVARMEANARRRELRR